MKIGIIAAMEQEVNILVDKLKDKTVSTVANQTFYNGIIDKAEVVLVQSGIGKVNAAIATTLLIEKYNAEVVINTGSAGGIGKELKIGDLVVSTELSYNDADARIFGYDFGQIPQMPSRYKADSDLIDNVSKAADKMNWLINKGLIVTGDSFIANSDKISDIKGNFPEALVTEMEGAAVAQTCYQFGVPVVVVRALSDTSDEKASVSFEEFIEQAGKKSAEMVLNFLKDL
ncbi:5'-methylthioadenosine/S-adenosylhomocysteine nucleosidase [Marinilactibacillus sp. 15R]|uniref:5'-methylthioadenosine/adenosylhomocysteine nucleosidase n=1 Tax=Marinilactibacillus sp. 15R TaxID=1911586 RepID=UPI00090A4920|nr:5'-methylthioadenosine/adenosylhomocysteine nucleosidase [Marinilactibacillus sp. 15R]API89163.1 5'-methylthioadenosine/S-adenosylhomocysteine nucleosidase [Marinilactibacillus sp. 15R]